MITEPGRDVRLRVYGYDETAAEMEAADARLLHLLTSLADARLNAGMKVMSLTPEETLMVTRAAALQDHRCPALDLPLGASQETVWAALTPVTALRCGQGLMHLRQDPALQQDVTALEAALRTETDARQNAEGWKEGALHCARGGAATHNPYQYHRDPEGRKRVSGWANGFHFARGADLGGLERERFRETVRALHGQVWDALHSPAGVVPDSCQDTYHALKTMQDQNEAQVADQ